MKFIFALLLAVLSLANGRPRRSPESSGRRGASKEPSVNSVWLLPKNYSQFVFSAPHNTLLGLTEDGFTVDALSLTNKKISHSYPLPLPGYRLAIGLDGTYATVVHNSYITFMTVDSTVSETLDFPFADSPVSGLVADLSNEHESCGWISSYNSGSQTTQAKIICANPSSRNVSECNDEGAVNGYVSVTLGTPDHQMVYGVTANGYVLKYTVDKVTPPQDIPRCPSYDYFRRPAWGTFNYPSSAWFSYDRTRMFLNNGLTLTVSKDFNDLVEHGTFNGSFVPQYFYWIAQNSRAPNDILALRRVYSSSSYQLLATRYSWPYLQGKSDIDIPVPTTPAGLSVSSNRYMGSRVYFNPTKSTEVYIIVNYTDGSLDNYTPGVAFVDINS